jgi:DNA-binding Xre family transcriptional regulator
MLTRRQLESLRGQQPVGRNRLTAAMEAMNPRTTQVDLAEAIGVTQAYISRLCTGNYQDVPLETSRAIAEFFGCQIEDLFPARSEVA